MSLPSLSLPSLFLYRHCLLSLLTVSVQASRGGDRNSLGRGQARQARPLATPSGSEEQSKYSSALESDDPTEKMDWGRAAKGGGREANTQGGRDTSGRGRGGGPARAQGQGGPMWECSTCTYHNDESKLICDMCR